MLSFFILSVLYEFKATSLVIVQFKLMVYFIGRQNEG
ncbi:hypothetical protein BCE_4600 [Bacillus cereus ATCC 10987]|uniref:Uncharacterized protein n=1 Tax=Bacillus cereus (strain ATCC 10987 / NRS 248) TaxID=222523 RepID=Q72ZR8_BACC1|nr:hypothetical protein BCE_4600 [Bacillus cereus ATCC 10987]